MSQTVLVIDSNSAVQAITTLALNQTDCAVETLADGAQAYDRIRQLAPNVVLCAKEIAGVDPFDLCRRVKRELSHTAFILLAPAEGVQATNKLAKEADYDEVIFKPFKSNRLREIVTQLIERLEKPQQSEKSFYLAIADSLRRRIVERYLARFDCTVLPYGGESPALSPAVICVSDTAQAIPAGFSGSTIFLAEGSKTLTVRRLAEKFSSLTPRSPAEAGLPSTGDRRIVGSNEPAQLAAEISARIFSRLLTAPALASGNWEEVARIAADEARKSCRR